jgi:hypothetical protein
VETPPPQPSPQAQGNRILCSRGLSAGSLRLSRLRGKPTRSKGAAGGGSLHAANPDAEAPPPQPSPASGRGSAVPMSLHLGHHMRLPCPQAGEGAHLPRGSNQNLIPSYFRARPGTVGEGLTSASPGTSAETAASRCRPHARCAPPMAPALPETRRGETASPGTSA